jgi:AraC-like DNA-binding protein
MPHDAEELNGPGVSARFWRVPEGDTEVLEARFRSHSFSPHRHERYVFGMVTGGVEGFRYRGQSHFTPAGHLAILEPDELHDGYPGIEAGWAYRMTYLDPALLEQAAQAAFGSRWQGLPGFAETVIDDPALAEQCLTLFASLREPDQLARSSGLLETLTALVIRHGRGLARSARPLPNPGDRRLDQVRELLRADPAARLTLEELARYAGLSPFHLLRSFRRQYGLPPHGYQMQVRLQAAESALKQGSDIADVAAACGFADQAHLTRSFKRYRGVTPGQFRRAAA